MILAGGYAGEAERFRFRAEAEAVARLKYPGVVHIYDIGEIEGRQFCSMEFVEGGSLVQKLAGTPQPPREVAELVEALARAMHAAHAAGVVHRDLKPANVWLASGGCEPPGVERTGGSHPPLAPAVPKITDFGLAKNLGDDSAHTRTGAIMGTPSYLAPEQAEGKVKDIGPAADVWALGAILYECLTGRPPFKGATTLETLDQVRSQEPVAPSQLQPATPRDLETICLKCLQKEPARRYASAEELADDAKERADDAKERAEKANDYLSLALAREKLVANDLSTDDALLDDCHPTWRNFEWFLLKQQTRQDLNALGLIAQNANAVAFSPDGRYLALTADKTISVRDLATLRTVSTFDGHKAFVGAVVFLPGGRIASGGADKMVRIWNSLTGKQLFTLPGHTDTVSQVALSPDGKSLASAERLRVRLWDAATG
jgi:serine/threonine protein kinase